jgi:holliday junction resolvase Hjr
MISTKQKGSRGERDLIHLFWGTGWAAMRAAGSGSSQFPSPDLIVGRSGRRLVIEVKVTSSQRKYFSSKEITQLHYFAKTFGAEPWLAIKFPKTPWWFISPEDLSPSGSSFVVSLKDSSHKSLLFEELIQE